MKKEEMELEKLVDMADPYSVLAEVRHTTLLMSPDIEFGPIEEVFEDILKLFRGEFPGYRRCNTEYHDLQHTTDTFLAAARLIHGASIKGHHFSRRNISLGLIGALMHDTGYIQTVNDAEGTGAKYTLEHISRSIAFMEKYFSNRKYYSPEDLDCCGKMLNCTGFSTKVGSIDFFSNEIEALGKILGAADLLGQMADRKYLEKLLFLYEEFVEGKIMGFEDEFDLLKKTVSFYDMTKKRLAEELGGVNRYMIHHFRARWNIDRDLYSYAIEKNIRYLNSIVKKHEKSYRTCLRRNGMK